MIVIKMVMMMMTMNVFFPPCFWKVEESSNELLVEQSFVWKDGLDG